MALNGSRSGALLGIAAALLLTTCRTAKVPLAGDEERPVVVIAAVDRARATTGDLVRFSVEVSRDPAYVAELAGLELDLAGFPLLEVGRDEPRKRRGRIIETHWAQFRADLVGSYILPGVTVHYRSQEKAESGSVETAEIFVEVVSVLPTDGAASDIRDIKPLQAMPASWRWIVWLGVLLGVLVGVAAYLYWRKKQRSVVAPPIPAHVLALAALRRLRRTDLQTSAEKRRYYFEISAVLRGYVEGRYRLNATDLTTEEILDNLDGLGIENEECTRLRRFLLHGDQVKFAASIPTQEEILATYERAFVFVENTGVSC